MASALQKLVKELSDETRQMILPPEGYAPQVVFSGDSRQQIANRHFASEDTDPDIQSVASGKKSSIIVGNPEGSKAMRLNRLIENPPSVVGAVLTSLGLLLVSNIFAVMILSITKQNIYNVGWAFEIYLVAGFFTLLAWATHVPWLLTPASIVFGNAVILSYCALTGRWQDWAFLWMLEPIIIAAAILMPMKLQKRAEQGAYWTRAISLLLTVLAVLMTVSTCWLSFIVNLFR